MESQDKYFIGSYIEHLYGGKILFYGNERATYEMYVRKIWNQFCIDSGVGCITNINGLTDALQRAFGYTLGIQYAPTETRVTTKNNNIKQYRKILLQGNKDAIVGLPSGDWNMNLTEWAVTYDQPTFTPAAGTNGFVKVTRQSLQPTDGVITVTFKVKEQFKQEEVLRYDYIKVNKMVPRVAN